MTESKTTEVWRGIFKVGEEMNELGEVLGKLGAFPSGDHPDGKGNLIDRMHEEIADVLAALDYFVSVNRLDRVKISGRECQKLDLFHKWVLTGIKL